MTDVDEPIRPIPVIAMHRNDSHSFCETENPMVPMAAKLIVISSHPVSPRTFGRRTSRIAPIKAPTPAPLINRPLSAAPLPKVCIAMAGISTVHIPYNGGSAAVTALIAGDVQVLSLNPTALLPQVAAGKARVIAQTLAKRSALIADVPTVAESGYPGYEAGVWMAIMVPAKTAPDIVRRLNAELVRIIRDPAMKAALWDRQWIDPVGSTPEELPTGSEPAF